ncbi:MAG: prepilin peptidase [Phascolarctobacterium sp.]
MDYYLLAFALGLARHCYTDLRYMLLYDSTNCFLLLLGLGRAWQQSLLEQGWQGAVVLGGLMLLLYYASRGGVGEGDVKLAAVLGLWLGVQQGLVCLLVAFTSGACLGGVLLLLQQAERRTQLPFGPFLCGGGLLAYVYGRDIVAWYGQFL